MKLTIFQMVRMMIDGIIGVLNWGTKWDVQNSIDYDEECLELLSTAWSPPEGIC